MFIWMFHLGQSRHLSFSCERAFLLVSLSFQEKLRNCCMSVFKNYKNTRNQGGLARFTVVLIVLAWKLASVALFLPLSCFTCSFNSSSLYFSSHFLLLTKMEDITVPTCKCMVHPHFWVMSTFLFLHIKRGIIELERVQKRQQGWLHLHEEWLSNLDFSTLKKTQFHRMES